MPRHGLANFRIGVIQISRENAVCWANDNTCRLHSGLDSMRAIMTFCCCFGRWINMNGIIWTRLHASFASNADLGVKLHDTIVPLIHGRYRTNANTRWIRAMIASGHLKIPTHIWIYSRVRVFHPGSTDAKRNLILTLTSRRASMATNAAARVYKEAIVHNEDPILDPTEKLPSCLHSVNNIKRKN